MSQIYFTDQKKQFVYIYSTLRARSTFTCIASMVFSPSKVSLGFTKIRKFQSLSQGRKIQDFRKKIKISTRKFFENRRKFSKEASLRVTFSLKFGLPKGWFLEVKTAFTPHLPTLVPPGYSMSAARFGASNQSSIFKSLVFYNVIKLTISIDIFCFDESRIQIP